MDRFNRVLAIDPHHEKVRALSARIGKRERLIRRAKQAVLATALMGALGIAGWGAATIAGEAPPPEPEPVIASYPAPPPPVEVSLVEVIPPPPPPELVAPPPLPPPPPPPPPRAVRSIARKVANPEPDLAVKAMAAPEQAAPVPLEARLTIRVGPGFGDIHVGDKVFKNSVVHVAKLPVGRHEVFVEKPKNSGVGVPGYYRPRTVEVDEDGRIWAILDGRRSHEVSELRFRVARDQKEIDGSPTEFPGWTSY
jgi:hypothetical protein